jgi:hypothetical protein
VNSDRTGADAAALLPIISRQLGGLQSMRFLIEAGLVRPHATWRMQLQGDEAILRLFLAFPARLPFRVASLPIFPLPKSTFSA